MDISATYIQRWLACHGVYGIALNTVIRGNIQVCHHILEDSLHFKGSIAPQFQASS